MFVIIVKLKSSIRLETKTKSINNVQTVFSGKHTFNNSS